MAQDSPLASNILQSQANTDIMITRLLQAVTQCYKLRKQKQVKPSVQPYIWRCIPKCSCDRATRALWDMASWDRGLDWASGVVHRWHSGSAVAGWRWGEQTARHNAKLGSLHSPVPLLVTNATYTQQLHTKPGIRLTGWLLGTAHKQHRYRRYFQNNTYYSTNSGLEKWLMLLDLNTQTTAFWHKVIPTHFKEKQYKQKINIGAIQQFFFSLLFHQNE